jgi:hypothetical protein
MPATALTGRITRRRGRPRMLIANLLMTAARDIQCTEEDRFITISEHDESGLFFSDSYFDITRTANLVIIQRHRAVYSGMSV